MNRPSIRFGCTALAGTNKAGRLPKDANGYYTIPVGGLNVFNNSGDYYVYEEAKELFQGSSALMRRVKSGCLKGEYGHPKPNGRIESQEQMEAYAARVMQVQEPTTCVHFSEIWLDFESVKDQQNNPVIAIMAKLTPSGPMGPALACSLENNNEEVCFSIRAFTEDKQIRGVKNRWLREIVTWDYVHEPGLSMARKYRSPTLESYQDVTFNKEAIVSTLKQTDGLALESTQSTGLNLIRTLGWDLDPSQIPKYLKW